MTNTTQIMNEMDRTRDEIRATLGAIAERASVERVMQEYIMPTKTSAVELGRIFADAVRANPLPLGLTAVGLGWLMLGQRNRPAAIAGPGGRSESEYGAGVVAERYEVGTTETAKRRVDDTLRRAGEKVEHAKASARNLADEAVGRVREAAGKGRQWTAETAERASDTIRRSVDTAYDATKHTAAEVGGRVRAVARRPVRYAQQHPLALGAALVVGGAALALLLARRAATQQEDLAPAGMPETPYASGAQAETGGLHRNPTEPLTPEEEEPVFASGDVSAEAIHPAAEAPVPSQETTGESRPKETVGRGGPSDTTSGG